MKLPYEPVCPSVRRFVVRLSVCHNLQKRAGNFTSMLLISEHLFSINSFSFWSFFLFHKNLNSESDRLVKRSKFTQTNTHTHTHIQHTMDTREKILLSSHTWQNTNTHIQHTNINNTYTYIMTNTHINTHKKIT